MSMFIFNFIIYLSFFVSMFAGVSSFAGEEFQRARAREIGIEVGVMETGKWNAITDVPGVKVGHMSIIQGNSVRTGVNAILPHEGNIYQEKVPAAIYVGNGFGQVNGMQ